MRITDADEAMLPQILEIERACFSDPWTLPILQGQLSPSPGHIFLAALEGEETVTGYAGLTHVLDEGCVTNVAVAPAWRRRGVAGALLDELERRARTLLKLAFLTLEVRFGNVPAIALYEKHGFAVVGRRRNYYEKPVEDAVLMTLMLGNGGMR